MVHAYFRKYVKVLFSRSSLCALAARFPERLPAARPVGQQDADAIQGAEDADAAEATGAAAGATAGDDLRRLRPRLRKGQPGVLGLRRQILQSGLGLRGC